MKLKKGNPIILNRSLIKFYNFRNNSNKLALALSNQQELLDLKISSLFYFNQKRLNKLISEKKIYAIYRYKNNDKSYLEDYKFISKNYIPIIKGFLILNSNIYHENISPIFIKIINYLPYNKDVGVIKYAYRSQIEGNKINIYDNDSFILKVYKNNTIENLLDVITYEKNQKVTDINSAYESKFLFKNFKKNNLKKKDCVILSHRFSYIKENQNENELISFPRRLFHIFIALESLKTNGNLYYPFTSFTSLASLQMFSNLYSLFESYKFINSEFDFAIEGYFIFYNYVGHHNFYEIYNEIYEKDDSLGEKFVLSLENFDQFNIDIDVDEKFLKSYTDNLDIILSKKKKLIKKIRYVEEIYHIDKKRKQIVDDQVSFAINFCNQHKLKINRFYKNYFFKLDRLELKKKLFPNIRNIDFTKLKLDHTSIYSISYPNESEILSNLIKERFPKLKTIADMCSNVGGNTISFCKNFDFVYSIEIDNNIYKILKNNLEAYNFKNYELLNMDSNNFRKNVDLHFYDPPWSGIYYKINTNIDLYLSKINIANILKPNFCLKVPNNFNYSNLLKKFNNIEVISLKAYVIIFNKIY
tara:strand:+ start:8791 stop:10548 length:1758 start_codon:yes stop_codon:yes gene_type:complete